MQSASGMGQSRTAEERHANRLQGSVMMDGVDGHDVRMLQLRQSLWLDRASRRELQDHGSFAQLGLTSQIGDAKGAAPSSSTSSKSRNRWPT